MLAFYIAQIEDDQDKDKFTIIYQTYRSTMVKMADRMLQDHFLAEEAVQDTFLYILKILKNIEDPASSQTKAVVNKSLFHICVDKRRLQQKEQKYTQPLTDDDICLIPDTHDIVSALEEADEYTQLTKHFLELPDEDRELMSLFYFSKIPAKEIAALLQVSKKTVYNRIHAVTNHLQECLREENLLE